MGLQPGVAPNRSEGRHPQCAAQTCAAASAHGEAAAPHLPRKAQPGDYPRERAECLARLEVRGVPDSAMIRAELLRAEPIDAREELADFVLLKRRLDVRIDIPESPPKHVEVLAGVPDLNLVRLPVMPAHRGFRGPYESSCDLVADPMCRAPVRHPRDALPRNPCERMRRRVGVQDCRRGLGAEPLHVLRELREPGIDEAMELSDAVAEVLQQTIAQPHGAGESRSSPRPRAARRPAVSARRNARCSARRVRRSSSCRGSLPQTAWYAAGSRSRPRTPTPRALRRGSASNDLSPPLRRGGHPGCREAGEPSRSRRRPRRMAAALAAPPTVLRRCPRSASPTRHRSQRIAPSSPFPTGDSGSLVAGSHARACECEDTASRYRSSPETRSRAPISSPRPCPLAETRRPSSGPRRAATYETGPTPHTSRDGEAQRRPARRSSLGAAPSGA